MDGTEFAASQPYFMSRIRAFSFLALACLTSCAQVSQYEPVSRHEEAEYGRARSNVYPDEVRADLDKYTNAPVVWVGIIRSSDAQEEDIGSKIRLDTVFEHHYFDWREQGHGEHPQLKVSSRGEGRFRTRWSLHRTDPYMDSTDVDAHDAEHYAAPRKLAIFYGTPVSIDPDGTIVLTYHYVRIIPIKDYTTNGVNYGRLGDFDQPLGGQPQPTLH